VLPEQKTCLEALQLDLLLLTRPANQFLAAHRTLSLPALFIRKIIGWHTAPIVPFVQAVLCNCV
jgi:hypothetical protein